jgi:hypothetical protein
VRVRRGMFGIVEVDVGRHMGRTLELDCTLFQGYT